MSTKDRRSPSSFSRQALDHAAQLAERAEDAEMAAMLAWAHMREARERLRVLDRARGRRPDPSRTVISSAAA
jgi:hypothetical protein